MGKARSGLWRPTRKEIAATKAIRAIASAREPVLPGWATSFKFAAVRARYEGVNQHAERAEGRGERADHIGQTAGLGEGRSFRGNHQDAGHEGIVPSGSRENPRVGTSELRPDG